MVSVSFPKSVAAPKFSSTVLYPNWAISSVGQTYRDIKYCRVSRRARRGLAPNSGSKYTLGPGYSKGLLLPYEPAQPWTTSYRGLLRVPTQVE